MHLHLDFMIQSFFEGIDLLLLRIPKPVSIILRIFFIEQSLKLTQNVEMILFAF